MAELLARAQPDTRRVEETAVINATLGWLQLPEVDPFPDSVTETTEERLRELYGTSETPVDELLLQAARDINAMKSPRAQIDVRLFVSGLEQEVMKLAAPKYRVSLRGLRRAISKNELGATEEWEPELSATAPLGVVEGEAREIEAAYTSVAAEEPSIEDLMRDAEIAAVEAEAAELVVDDAEIVSLLADEQPRADKLSKTWSETVVRKPMPSQRPARLPHPTVRRSAQVETSAESAAAFRDLNSDERADVFGLPEESSWQERALCAQTDPEAFFPEKGGSTREAKQICTGCEVRSECLEYALEKDERFGIWGGLSERERRRLKRRAV